MKILAIIAEYNPFHNGHKYQIEQARALTKADFVIVIMSGSFTQQGNIAILDKFERANIAIAEGADLVIELPTVFSVSCAEDFAFGAVNILNLLKCVNYLSFGAECDDINILNNIVDKLLKNEGKIEKKLVNSLKSGNSYVSIKHKVLGDFLSQDELNEITKPNNILAIEYLKALKKLNSSIAPVIIKRNGMEHNEICLDNRFNNQLDFNNLNEELFLSSSSIRNILSANVNTPNAVDTLNKLKKFIPDSCYKLLRISNICLNEGMFKLLRYKILCMESIEIQKIQGVCEGLENRIYKAALLSKSYNELIRNIKSKRFTESRIKRILVCILLGITKEKYVTLKSAPYARILKADDNNKACLLKILRAYSLIPVISSIRKNELFNSNIDNIVMQNIDLDLLSANVRDIVANSILASDLTNRI